MTAPPAPERLAALHRAAFRHPRPWSAAEIAALLAAPGVFLLVEEAGFLIGRAIAGEAELLTLAVDPAARRQGIGSRLLAGFCEAARRQGAERAFLEVAADNGPALALYRRHGFVEAGRRRGYYASEAGAAVDALVLALALEQPAAGRGAARA